MANGQLILSENKQSAKGYIQNNIINFEIWKLMHNILFKSTYIYNRNKKIAIGTINPKSGEREKKKCLRNMKSLNSIHRNFISYQKKKKKEIQQNIRV